MKIYCIIIFFFITIQSACAELLVIGHSDIKPFSITISELSNIFMKKHSTLNDGTPVVPINRAANSDIRNQFESKVIKMSKRDIRTYWLKLRFKGIRPPVVMKSTEAAILFVKRFPGAITYIDSSNQTTGVNILMRIK